MQMLMLADSVSGPARPTSPRIPGSWGPVLSCAQEGLAVAADVRPRLPFARPFLRFQRAHGPERHSCGPCPWVVRGLGLKFKVRALPGGP